jgi:hypothetical protein
MPELKLFGFSLPPITWGAIGSTSTLIFYFFTISHILYFFYFLESLLALFISLCWLYMDIFDIQTRRKAGEQAKWSTMKHLGSAAKVFGGSLILLYCGFTVGAPGSWQVDIFHGIFALYEIVFVALLLGTCIASAQAAYEQSNVFKRQIREYSAAKVMPQNMPQSEGSLL